MKDNTYIIPAVDFYVGISEFGTPDNIFKELKEGKIKFIPFECVDGLLIEDLGFLLLEKNLIVVAINKLNFYKGENKQVINNVLNLTVFNKEELDSLKEKTIDKVVEDIYESKYEKASLRTRRFYNSFFERYQDGDYNKTKERVKKLIENNRK